MNAWRRGIPLILLLVGLCVAGCRKESKEATGDYSFGNADLYADEERGDLSTSERIDRNDRLSDNEKSFLKWWADLFE